MRAKLAGYLKDRRGFTLIELMMVVAVIIILAAVLVPRIVTAKKDVKIAGVLQNLNAVQGVIEARINRYASDANKLCSTVANIVNKDDTIKNPYTGKTGMVEKNLFDPLTGAAVIYEIGTSDPSPNDDEQYQGLVYLYVKKKSDTDPTIIAAYLYPYDGAGNAGGEDERRTIQP